MLLNNNNKEWKQQQQQQRQVEESAMTTRRSFPLPPELLYEIFNYLEGCQPALYAACLVCKQWLYCAAPILYCHPQINDTYRWATFILTLTRERMTFSYGNLIRSIDLSSGKSIEAMKDQEFYRRLSSSNINTLDNNTNNSGNHNSNNNNANTTISNYSYPNGVNVHVITRNNNNNSSINSNNNSNSSNYNYNNYHHGNYGNHGAAVPLKGLPYIIVSTSSLIQLSHTCKYITTLNLSYTSLLNDSVIAETGEYLSTLQHYANNQPGLTHIQIPIEAAIKAIGKECQQLVEVKVQRCEWVTAHVIWMFVYYCTNLKRLDARRSTKCTIKRLIATVLEAATDSSLSLLSNRNNNEFTMPPPPPPPSSSISSSSTGTNVLYVPQNNEDELDDMDQSNTNDRFVFNEETGSYEQHDFNRSRVTFMRQLIEDEQRLHGTFWFVPLPNNNNNSNTIIEDDVQYFPRRPPSPLHPHQHQQQQQQQLQQHQSNHQHHSTSIIDYKSLKNIVKEILEEAKHSGIADISWLQDYPL